jgi:D-sedoheptulose 7-phosphate isomerase
MSLARIRQQFAENIEHSMKAAELLPEALVDAGNKLVASLVEGGRIFSAGDHAGAHMSSQFASLLLQGQGQRPPLPAWQLSNRGAAEHGAATLQALAQRGDVLVLIHPSTNSAEQLIGAAHDKDALVILVSPETDNRHAVLCTGNDVAIIVPADSSQRFNEVSLLIIHTLCDHIEQQLFGDLS